VTFADVLAGDIPAFVFPLPVAHALSLALSAEEFILELFGYQGPGLIV
jgi:hypothetical protein